MSQEEIEAKEAADLKALSVQQSLADSMAKIAEFAAIPLSFIASMVDSGPIMIGIMTSLAVLLGKAALSAGITAASLAPFALP